MVDDDGEGGEQRGEGEFGQRGDELRGVLGAEELAAGVVEQAGGGEAVVGGEGLGGGGGGRVHGAGDLRRRASCRCSKVVREGEIRCSREKVTERTSLSSKSTTCE